MDRAMHGWKVALVDPLPDNAAKWAAVQRITAEVAREASEAAQPASLAERASLLLYVQRKVWPKLMTANEWAVLRHEFAKQD